VREIEKGSLRVHLDSTRKACQPRPPGEEENAFFDLASLLRGLEGLEAPRRVEHPLFCRRFPGGGGGGGGMACSRDRFPGPGEPDNLDRFADVRDAVQPRARQRRARPCRGFDRRPLAALPAGTKSNSVSRRGAAPLRRAADPRQGVPDVERLLPAAPPRRRPRSPVQPTAEAEPGPRTTNRSSLCSAKSAPAGPG